jgi:hypothetical protein
LQHTVYTVDGMFYFYDGELPMKAGVITVPNTRPDVIANAFKRGFQIDPKSGAPYSIEDLVDVYEGTYVGDEPTQEAVSTEQQDKKDDTNVTEKSPRRRRQPVAEDGVRPSEQASDTSVPVEGLEDSSVDLSGPEPADAGRDSGIPTE